jgi:hypothetical protein
MRRTGYASEADLIELLNKSGILNAQVIPQDVQRANKIYGAEVASLKGKTKLTKTPAIKVEYVPKPVITTQVLYIDLMYVIEEPYLVTYTEPVGVIQVSYLNRSRHARIIADALMKHIKTVSNGGFEVQTIVGDQEFNAAIDLINHLSVRFNPAASRKHVPLIENRIRQIKECIRCHLHALPYKLPLSVMKWLVYYVVTRLNQMPNHLRGDGSITPDFELLKGRKLDFNIDFKIGFGEYVQTESLHEVNRNSMKSRTER